MRKLQRKANRQESAFPAVQDTVSAVSASPDGHAVQSWKVFKSVLHLKRAFGGGMTNGS